MKLLWIYPAVAAAGAMIGPPWGADQTLAHAENLSQLETAVCQSKRCWQELAPMVSRLGNQVVEALQKYSEQFAELDETAASIDESDTEGAQASLDYRLELARDALRQCEQLKLSGGKIQQLIVVGHAFKKDGPSFRVVAEGLRKEQVDRLCAGKKSAERAACAAQVVVVEDLQKDQLAALLGLASEGSIARVFYVGHGIEDAIGIGGRSALLPLEWTPRLKISRTEWRHANKGMLYVEDLDTELGASLSRALAPDATIDLYACRAGEDLGPALKQKFDLKAVNASRSPLHLAWLGPDGKQYDRDAPKGSRRILVPDYGRFGEVSTLGESKQGSEPAPSRESMREPLDQAARDITMRLIKGSDHGPIRIATQNRAAFFSAAERKFMTEALESSADLHAAEWKRESMDSAEILRILKESAGRAPGAKQPTHLRTLDKLRLVFEEATRLYYP